MKQLFLCILLLALVACSSLDQLTDTDPISKKQNENNSLLITHSFDPLSKEEAIKVAQRFTSLIGIQTKANGAKDVESVCSITDNQGNPSMYAINFGNDNGFAIVNTSKKYFPVLAFSETGHFSQDRNASGLDIWINEQITLINAAKTLPLDSLTDITKSWLNYEKRTPNTYQTKAGDSFLPFRDSAIAEWELDGYECLDLETSAMYLNPIIYNEWCELAEEQSNPNYDYMETAVVLYYASESTTQHGPFISTTWGRYEPYNEGLNQINGEYPPAACSIVAMSQIMRYHEWPTSYYWSTMNNNTASYYQKLLYYNLGEAANTTYNLNGSHASIYNVRNAITSNQFDYNASVITHSLQVVENNILSGKPVFMQGQDNSTAHAWVCDGRQAYTPSIHLILMIYTPDDDYSQAMGGNSYYSDSNTYKYYHMNWGEEGDADGWFYSDNVAFSGYLYNVLISFNYSSNRLDIVNISPDN